MIKNNYLEYFRKNDTKNINSEHSINQKQTNVDQPTEKPNLASGCCSVDSEQADTVDTPFANLSNQGQKSDLSKSLYFKEPHSVNPSTKNIRIHNHSSQMFKRNKEPEDNEQRMLRSALNVRKNFSQINPNVNNSDETKVARFMTSNKLRNQSQFGGQRLKTLQAPSILENQKLFTQPIKPYDRNKTARNKKFKTLKTAFGDLNSSCRNYNDEYTMSLENLRMGWRIVNTKSMIEEYLNSTYFTYHLYNGTVINKDKYKDNAQKEKKKVNLKQMKNVYKVFFNQNIMFNKKENKNPKIFQSIKKMDEVHEYVLSQSQMKQKSHSGTFYKPGENQPKRSEGSEHGKSKPKYRIEKPRSSHKPKPCFFRKTYDQKNHNFNSKLCELSKMQKTTKSLHCKSLHTRQKSFHENEKQEISMQQDHFRMNQIFGKGNIIIEIRDFQIQSTSSIKKDDLFVLELMAPTGVVHVKKGTMSSAIKYSDLKNGLKFAIDSKVGDFVPLKIWKYHGINLVEMGIIDLNLIMFKNRRKYFDLESNIKSEQWSNGIQDIQLFKQERLSISKHNRKQEREILYYHTKEKLRKNKKMEIEVTVSLNCLIYNKKFSRQKTNISEESEKENILAEDPDQENDLQ